MRRNSFWLATMFLVLGSSASATTYVMMADGDLADQSPLIVQGRVLSVQTGVTHEPVTLANIAVESVLKGGLDSGELVVRIPGGRTMAGQALQVWGVPRFAQGERVLLLLAPRQDGTYGAMHLILGVFHQVASTQGSLAVRHLDGARQMELGDQRELPEPGQVRDFARFSAWLADRGAGQVRPADYFVQQTQADLQSIRDQFTLFEVGGVNLRWFFFDDGDNVEWRAHRDGQPGVAGGGFSEFQAGIRTWNNDPGSNVIYTYQGTTSASGGLNNSDGTNGILFADPNEEMPGTFDCSVGGTLAIGGPWFLSTDTDTFNGRTFIRIQEADIVTNDGADCIFSQAADRSAEETMAHELGHTLGLGHSCGDPGAPNESCSVTVEDEALMRALVHADGRGGVLNSDDQEGIAFLYSSAGPPPTEPPAEDDGGGCGSVVPLSDDPGHGLGMALLLGMVAMGLWLTRRQNGWQPAQP